MHEHHPADFWTRVHPEPIVLDIGGEVGALIIHASESWLGREIEVAPVAGGPPVHTAVLRRQAGGAVRAVAVFPELAAGTYVPTAADAVGLGPIEVRGGEITEVDWRG